jgi:hypothetical protein
VLHIGVTGYGDTCREQIILSRSCSLQSLQDYLLQPAAVGLLHAQNGGFDVGVQAGV